MINFKWNEKDLISEFSFSWIGFLNKSKELYQPYYLFIPEKREEYGSILSDWAFFFLKRGSRMAFDISACKITVEISSSWRRKQSLEKNLLNLMCFHHNNWYLFLWVPPLLNKPGSQEKNFFLFFRPFGLSGWIRQLHLWKAVRPLPYQRVPWYDTKLYLMVRLQSWIFGVCEVPLHCHYS